MSDPVPPQAGRPDPVLLRRCHDAVPDILSLTECLVNMDSGTEDPPALRRKAELLADLFGGLGADARLVEAPPPREGTFNVVSSFKGTGRAKVLILTHYDTVFPPGESARRPFRRDRENAYGPGVADMQSAIAMLVLGLPILHATSGAREYDTLTVVCNADEETGSWGGRALIRELAARHDVALNMELSGAEGNLITVSGRGIANGTLTVRGRAAHAGSEPAAGLNAGYELAHQLLQLRDLSRDALRTSVHWTMGGFGTRSNVIPDHAEATANIRVADPAEFRRVEDEIRRRIENRLIPGCEVAFSMAVSILPYRDNPVTLRLAEKVRDLAARELGLSLGFRHAIGGNDTSFSALECPSLDGFGPGCVGMHSEQEALPIHTIAPRLYLLLRTLQEIFAGRFVPLGGEA